MNIRFDRLCASIEGLANAGVESLCNRIDAYTEKLGEKAPKSMKAFSTLVDDIKEELLEARVAQEALDESIAAFDAFIGPYTPEEEAKVAEAVAGSIASSQVTFTRILLNRVREGVAAKIASLFTGERAKKAKVAANHMVGFLRYLILAKQVMGLFA